MTSPALLLLVLWATAPLVPPTVEAHPHPTPTARPRSSTHNAQTGDYSFAYAVDTPEDGNFHDRAEARVGEETRGRFRVALPDNRLQTVLYKADDKGYHVFISYDPHPDFPALRASIGPIGDAPEIGQSVVESIRRGENWKGHKDQKDGEHDHDSRHTSHQELDNAVVPTPRRVQPSPRVEPKGGIRSTIGDRTSTTVRPRTTTLPTTRAQPTSRQPRLFSASPPEPKPSSRTSSSPPVTSLTSQTQRPKKPSLTSDSGQETRRLKDTGARKSPSRSSTNTRTSVPSISSEAASLFISAEDFDDPQRLTRLIVAIREKAAEGMQTILHGDDHDSKEKEPHRHYSIGDKASVLDRLRAVVHTVHLARLRAN
ncbi:uncharacterized protein [Procambarus clarkii]|uniref:uncharacterized protein n=1 Tax=Procambarus clarkii TaxID=6728 RepID=UPI001E676076|nr:uncharacterized protein LOC123768720 [Procambarus clarkii]